MRESTIEQYLVDQVKAAGGEVRKVKWIGRRGAPDRRVMLPARGGWWVELKRPGLDAEDHQLREHARMHRMGERVLVIDSKEAVDLFLRGAMA